MNAKEALECINSNNLKAITPKELGLRGKATLYLAGGALIQVVDRKSRFLTKDAQRFLSFLDAARDREGEALEGVVGVRTAPVCSKARNVLEEQLITVLSL